MPRITRNFLITLATIVLLQSNAQAAGFSLYLGAASAHMTPSTESYLGGSGSMGIHWDWPEVTLLASLRLRYFPWGTDWRAPFWMADHSLHVWATLSKADDRVQFFCGPAIGLGLDMLCSGDVCGEFGIVSAIELGVRTKLADGPKFIARLSAGGQFGELMGFIALPELSVGFDF